jgi:hypothetical protein
MDCETQHIEHYGVYSADAAIQIVGKADACFQAIRA